MNVNEMKGKTVVELNDELNKLLQEQFNLRMQKGTGQMTNVNELRRVRRDIARVYNIMSLKTSEGIEAFLLHCKSSAHRPDGCSGNIWSSALPCWWCA